MSRYLDAEDLIDAQGVAELLGPAQRNTVSAYQRRYPAMPRPVVDLGKGRCKLWLGTEIKRWRTDRLERGSMTVIDETIGHHSQEIVRGDVPGGPSTSQTIMVASLQRLLSVVPPTGAPEKYRSAVMDENTLAKQTNSGRDRKAANNTVNGLLKLLWPNSGTEVPDDALAWAGEVALELRRRVKEQQAAIGVAEFGKTDLSYRLGDRAEKVVYCDESLQHRLRAVSDPVLPVAGVHAQHDSEVLPEPDPAEVRSSAGAHAADYVPGDVIDGRFEVLELLGRGGFSKVYRVRDEVEGEERAFKLFDTAAGYQAVRREIGALRKIHHPNIVEVFWAGRTKAGDWYLVTEYIEGESLDDYATGKRHLRDREATDVSLDVLDALVAIHPDSVRIEELDRKKHEGEVSEAEYAEWMELQDKGLVHRDIKPLNVMLTRTGAKLLDFNIASRVGDPVYTQSGTPPYQAPDADLTRWDVSTDLFAVGVMLYELLCDGQHPYPGSKPMLGEQVIDPRTIRSDLPPELAEFLVKACAPYRNERFSTAQAMKDALSALRSGGR